MHKKHQHKPDSSQAYVHNAKLIIITGPRGSGKTRACQQLAERVNGGELYGLISLPLFSGGEKIAIDLLDLQGGQRRLLATRASNTSKLPANLMTKDWRFLSNALVWGNQILESISDCRILILDELGPLELDQGKGLTAALPLLTARNYGRAFVVVRPSLIDKALGLWPWGQVVDIEASPDLLTLSGENQSD